MLQLTAIHFMSLLPNPSPGVDPTSRIVTAGDRHYLPATQTREAGKENG